jgi:hypothetical protein
VSDCRVWTVEPDLPSIVGAGNLADLTTVDGDVLTTVDGDVLTIGAASGVLFRVIMVAAEDRTVTVPCGS